MIFQYHFKTIFTTNTLNSSILLISAGVFNETWNENNETKMNIILQPLHEHQNDQLYIKGKNRENQPNR